MYTGNLSITIHVGSIRSNFKIIATEPDSGYCFVGLDDFKFNPAYYTCSNKLQNTE